METFRSKMILILASLLLISIAPGESIEGFDEDDEMIGCFVRAVCIHDKIGEFYDAAIGAGPQNYELYIDTVRESFEKMNIDITGIDWEFCMQVKEKACALSKEEQNEFFYDSSATIGEYLLEICRDPQAEPCIKADMACNQFQVLLAKYKAMGLCPVSETADEIESPMQPPLG